MEQLEQIDLGLIGGTRTSSNDNDTKSTNHTNNDISISTKTTGTSTNNDTNENTKLFHETTSTDCTTALKDGTSTNSSNIDDNIVMSVDHDTTFIAVGTSTTLPTIKNKEDISSLQQCTVVVSKLVDTNTEKNIGTIHNNDSCIKNNNDDDDDDSTSTEDIEKYDTVNNYKSIQYMNIYNNSIGHYLHTNEDHCLIINCTKQFWYWSLLERGYGFNSEQIYNTIDSNNNYFAPKLYWKTTSISGKQVDKHKAKRHKKPILPSLFPNRIWNDILFGMSDYDDDDDDDDSDSDDNNRNSNRNNTDKDDYDIMLLANDDKRIFQYRNQMKIPALRVYVLSSFETCTKPKTIFSNKNTASTSTSTSTNNPIHYKYLKRLIQDQDKAIQYVLDNIPTKIYRLHPNDMAMAHIIQPLPKVKMSKVVSSSGDSDSVQVDVEANEKVEKTIHLLQNITVQQWAQVKAVDIIYPNRPAIIIDGSDDGLIITITDIVHVSSMAGSDNTTTTTTTTTPTNTTNKNTTLTIIGQNRTASVSTRFRMLNEYCLDKLAPSSSTNTTTGSKSGTTKSKVHTTKNVIKLDNNENDDDDDDESDLDDSTGGANKKNRINIDELMKEIVSNMKNNNGKKFPLYTKISKFESVSTTLIEVALFLHSIVRTWVGTQLLSLQKSTTLTTTSTTTTDEKDKPIIIVTGTDAEIIMLLLDPEICRKVLHLPIVTLYNTGTKKNGATISNTSASTSTTGTGIATNQQSDTIVRDEADFLNQVEVVYKKHLTLHGITSFLIDIGASCERTIKQLTTNDNNSMKQEIDTTTTTLTTTTIRRRTPPVVLYPYDLLGVRVAKFFNHKDLFRGTIISYESIDSTTTTGTSSTIDVMNSSNTCNIIPTIDNCYFMVLYDDGDTEEYDIQQIYDYLKLYDKHFEDNLNLTVRNEKAMDSKRKQSNSIAQLIEQYMFQHEINIGGAVSSSSSSSSNKRTLHHKAPANTKQQKVSGHNDENDIANDANIENDNITQNADVEMKETTVCVTPTIATAIPIKTEESEMELYKTNDTITATSGIMGTPVQQKKRGRPRKSLDTNNTNSSEVVIASPATVSSIQENDFINKRVCKLIDNETYCNGTIKKCTIEKNCNKRTGIVTDRIVYKILFDDSDIIELDDKKEIRKMIRLYDKRLLLQQQEVQD